MDYLDYRLLMDKGLLLLISKHLLGGKLLLLLLLGGESLGVLCLFIFQICLVLL